MRYFRIPQHVSIANADGSAVLGPDGEPASLRFVEVIGSTVANDAKFGKSVQGLRVSCNLIKAISGRNPGEIVSLSDSDWELVRDATESPSAPYSTAVARQALSFWDAILEAKTDAAKLEPFS